MKLSKILLRASALVMALSLNACGKQVTLKDNSGLKQYTYTNGNQITNIGAPYLYTYDGKYYCTATESGTYTKYEGNPIISSTENASGSGNNSFFYTLDGRELFNAYHTHTVVAMAGGNRKLTIDRCGFREDGTFYMNGPTTTMQSAPSGENSLTKLEGNFTVSASSTAAGKPEAVLDGEFSATASGKNQEWCAEDGKKASLTIDFSEEKEIDCLRSYEDAATPKEVKITFSDGSVIDHVISIHTPRVGGDDTNRFIRFCNSNFNPHPRVGGDSKFT